MNDAPVFRGLEAVEAAIRDPARIAPPAPSAPAREGIDTTLTARNAIHGDFAVDATLAQALKDLMHNSRNWPDLDPVKREALEHIATKIARILSGDPGHADHWEDIQGYAKLVEQRL